MVIIVSRLGELWGAARIYLIAELRDGRVLKSCSENTAMLSCVFWDCRDIVCYVRGILDVLSEHLELLKCSFSQEDSKDRQRKLCLSVQLFFSFTVRASHHEGWQMLLCIAD